MRKYIAFVLTVVLIFSSLFTAFAASSASSGSSGGSSGGGSHSGGISSGGSGGVVYPTLTEGYVCQNRPAEIYFDTGDMFLNGDWVDFQDDPIIEEDEILCPARAFFEALLFSVDYASAEASITASNDGTTVIIPLNKHTITVNRVNFYTEYTARSIDDVQYIPAVAILNALGYVKISSEDNIDTYMESNLTYRITEDGKMTIKGEGIIPDFGKNEEKPWGKYAESIEKIVVHDGVSAVGSYSFNNFTSLVTVEMPNTVEKIGKFAFPDAKTFQEIIYGGTFDEWCSITNDENSNTHYAVVTYSDGYIEYSPTEDFEFLSGVILRYLGNASVVHIPEEINGETVLVLGDGAFEDTLNCYHIRVPATVTEIGCEAFKGCSSLRSINIPYGITELNGTFSDCVSLSNIDLPETLRSIGERTFRRCSSLTELNLPNITSIKTAAFEHSALTSFEVPLGIESIPKDAFNGCKNLTDITLPQGLTSIGSCAFEACSSLTVIDIPSTVENIGAGAFNACKYITKITLPRLSCLNAELFCDCYRLQNIILPSSITAVNTDAFKNCYSMTNVYFKGSRSEWQALTINEGNEYLTNAEIQCNYTGTAEYTVEFDTNGGDFATSSFSVLEGSVIEIPEAVPTRNHYSFVGWSFTPSAETAVLFPLDEYTVEEDIVLYAVWKPVPYIEATVDVYAEYSLVFAEIHNAPLNCTINTAAYKNGVLVSFESRVCNKETEVFAITKAYDTVKVMLWDNLTSLTPLCDSCIYDAEQAFLELCNSTRDYRGIHEALTSNIYAYKDQEKVRSLNDSQIIYLAKLMYKFCPEYSSIDEFNEICNHALLKLLYSSSSGGSGGNSSGDDGDEADEA